MVGAHRSYTSNKLSNTLRLETPVVEVPQNIQIVTAAVLADQQVTSTSDGLIRNVAGVTRLEHWGDTYARINARGARLSAFRNGMNITSTWGPLTEDMAFVDHVEFVKGPSSFMMSYGEPAGLYNTVTKRPEGQNKGEVGIMLGSYDFYRATADIQGNLDKDHKLQYRLNIVGQAKNSFRAYEYNDRVGIAPVISYQVNDRTKVTLEYIYQHAKMSNIGSYYVFATQGYATLPREFTLMDPGLDPTYIDDHNVTFNVQHKINDSWKLTAQASILSFQQQGSSMWPSQVNDDGTIIRSVSISDASNIQKFGQVFLNGDITTGSVRHRILGGLDLSDKQFFGDWNSDPFYLDSEEVPFDVNNPNYGHPINGYPNYAFQHRRDSIGIRERAGVGATLEQSSAGAYLQDELSFFDNKLRLTVAGRYTYVKSNDYNTTTIGKRFTPRVGLSYSIDNQTSVYALFDQSFVPQSGIRRDGVATKPVTGSNYEAGIKRNWLDGRWSSSLSVYRILKNNETTADLSVPAPSSFVLQLGQTTSQGVEFDVRGEIVNGLTLVANYAYTNSEITKADESNVFTIGNKVPGYATHTANAWLNYTIQGGALKGFGISGGFSYMGERTTWTWTGATGVQQLPDYFRLDGGLYYEVNKLRITANMFNILDEYLYSGAAYGAYYYWQAEPGRNWRLGVTYRF